jgi:ribosomal protection tetracycline resistance protein
MAGVKILSGGLKIRDSVLVSATEEETKINQIRVSKEGKIENVNEIHAGEVGLISGLGSAKVGDYIGQNPGITDQGQIGQPLLSTKVLPEEESMIAELAKALTELSLEDPALDFNWFKEENELQLKIMGWMQLDALKFMLEDRYYMKVQFEEPSVIYKETPKTEGFGYERYTMPKPCWAVVKFEISPGERGSGWVYESKISVDKVHQKYQNEVERTIPHALKQGIKGWEVTDLKISLIDGEDHEIHSRPGDFILATKVGLMEGLNKINTTLLEPILSFTIFAPEEMLGKVVSDITQMRGSFETPDIIGDRFEMKGLIPLASSMDYSVKLTSRSGGKARIFTQFHSYQPCTDEEGVVREYKGLSPLNRGKYILQHRGAIQ